jgi:hypothetical protein
MERLIAVYFPLKLTTICSKKLTKIIIAILILFALVFYSFTFVTSGLQPNGVDMICVTLETWFFYIYMYLLIFKNYLNFFF